MNFNYKTCRKLSGVIFLLADCVLLIGNFAHTNIAQLIAAILFISCALALSLSANNHRWLFYNATAVITAYVLVSFSGQGGGVFLQYLGGVIGVVGGLLIFRGALQRECNKQWNLMHPFSLIDRYPLATAGVIEGSCALFVAVGSLLNQDMVLFITASLWGIAHLFLIFSDEYLRNRFSRSNP